MIQVRHLRKSFRAVAAVRDISFDAADGAIIGLVGPNGAGKSTTLRMISGVLPPDGGTIAIDGSVPSDSRRVRSNIGALLDHRGLYPRLTAREHLEYFGRLRGMSNAALRERIDHLIETLGMRTAADRPAAVCSEGERVKVALGCAIVHAPRHLLLDEPTNGLDVPAVRALRAALDALRRGGTCIVFSSHVLSEVEHLCDRVVVVQEGVVVGDGAAGELRSRTGGRTLEDAFVELTDHRHTHAEPVAHDRV